MQIGVMMPIGEDDERHATLSYAEIRELALRTEAAGFDSVWIYDHLLFRSTGAPTAGVWEAWTILTALAEATQRVTLGALVMCTSFRNPAVLAKMAATLDDVSGGRLILGLGAGWHQPEYDAFGLPFDHRVDRFEEALQIIVPLLREGRVDFQGRYYAAPDCEIRPRGPRPHGPPILIGSARPRMLRLTARYADSWNTCWLGQPSALDSRRDALLAACADEARDPATLDITVGVSVAAPATGGDASTVENPEKVLGGSASEVAMGLLGYEQAGVSHIICSLDRADAESVSWLAQALTEFRAASSYPT